MIKSKILKQSIIVILCAFVLVTTLQAQTQVNNFYDGLAIIKVDYSALNFDRNGATVQTSYSASHLQGIAAANGYFYVTRSRPSGSNTQKLLIIEEATEKVVNTVDLDLASLHPGGIQIHGNILAIPFTADDQNAWINFYDISNPTSPTLAGTHTTSYGNAYCVGITEYDGHYLVAHFYSRSGSIKFYLFDTNFNLVREKVWRYENQNTSNWYPTTVWKNSTSYNYETMSLVKAYENGSSSPVYYMIMYYNTNTADVFYLDDPNLLDNLDVDMVMSLDCNPYGKGFRYGGGIEIKDDNSFRFLSTLKHLQLNKSDNVISLFEPMSDWPWKLSYNYDTGGQVDVAMNDNDDCVEIHRGSVGGSNEDKLYCRVGKLSDYPHKVDWGSGYNTGFTGEYVSIDLNNNGYCVASFRGAVSNNNKLYYCVGLLNSTTKTISWGSIYQYDAGGDVSVTINDDNHIVEVHAGSIGGSNQYSHYYRVGSINTSSKTITWLSGGKSFNSGGAISIAMDNLGNIVTAFRGEPGSSNANKLYYRVGDIDFASGVISWGALANSGTGGNIDISIDDKGNVLDVHSGSPGGSNHFRHYYRLGSMSDADNTINWQNSQRFDTGGLVKADINNNGYGINIHLGESGTSSANKLYSKQMDYSASLPTSINENNSIASENKGDSEEALMIFPNPAIDDFNVSFKAINDGYYVLSIYSLSGSKILEKELGYISKEERRTENMSIKLQSGLYAVEIKYGYRQTMIGKLIIK